MLSEPFIVLCFPSRAATMKAFVFANGIISSLALSPPFPFRNTTECDLFWFSLILIFNDSFYRLSIRPIKEVKRSLSWAFVEQQSTFQLSHTRLTAPQTHTTHLPPPLLDLENCNLQMRFISRQKRICKSEPLFSFWLGEGEKMLKWLYTCRWEQEEENIILLRELSKSNSAVFVCGCVRNTDALKQD